MAGSIAVLEREARDMCGVVGIAAASSNSSAVEQTLEALYELQHRGFDAAGVAGMDGDRMAFQKDTGHIKDVFPMGAAGLAAAIPGARYTVGHSRYSTVMGLSPEEQNRAVMPVINRKLATVENGNVENMYEIAYRYGVAERDCLTDGTALGATLAVVRDKLGSLSAAASEVFPQMDGAFSVIATDGEEMVLGRDIHGTKPFSVGTLPDGSIIAASETVALDRVDAEWMWDVEAGEIITIGKDGIRSVLMENAGKDQRFCSLEIPYLMSPDSKIGPNRDKVEWLRYYNLGYALADEHPMEDPGKYTVVGIPASGVASAQGYARALNMRYEQLVFKKDGTQKSFLAASPEERMLIISDKLLFNSEAIKDKHLVVIDDSAIEGNSATVYNAAFRMAGALSIHMRIPFPVVKNNCHLGVAMSEQKRLLSYGRTNAQQAAKVGADSLRHLSLGRFQRALAPAVGRLCTGCLGGEYATQPPRLNRNSLPLVGIT